MSQSAMSTAEIALHSTRLAGKNPPRKSVCQMCSMRVARVTNLARALGQLKERGVWVFGLAAEADQPYWQADLTGPLALVVGSEGSGLGRLVREACDVLVKIPMLPGSIDSLNASVAGSLVLYEAFRQRSAAPRGTLNRPT